MTCAQLLCACEVLSRAAARIPGGMHKALAELAITSAEQLIATGDFASAVAKMSDAHSLVSRAGVWYKTRET